MVLAEELQEVHAHGVALERGVHLPVPVLTWLELQADVPELVVVLPFHALEKGGNPADAALPQHDAKAGEPIQGAAEDDGEVVGRALKLQQRHGDGGLYDRLPG